MDSPRACGPPPPAAVYTDLDTAVAAIQGHAQCNGYALCKRDGKPRRIVYTCDRYGRAQQKSSTVHTSKRRPGSGSKKCGCTMAVVLKQDVDSGHWALSILDGTHNHDSSTDPTAHPRYRIAALESAVVTLINTLGASGINPAQILTTVRRQFPAAILVQKDVSNILQKSRLEQLNGQTPIQWLLEVCLLVSLGINLLTFY
jgi:hypothetical protein